MWISSFSCRTKKFETDVEVHVDPAQVDLDPRTPERSLMWIFKFFISIQESTPRSLRPGPTGSIRTSWTRSRSRSKKVFMSIQLNSISIQEAFHVDVAQNFHDPARSKKIFLSIQLKSVWFDPAQAGLDRSSSSRSGSIQLK